MFVNDSVFACKATFVKSEQGNWNGYKIGFEFKIWVSRFLAFYKYICYCFHSFRKKGKKPFKTSKLDHYKLILTLITG